MRGRWTPGVTIAVGLLGGCGGGGGGGSDATPTPLVLDLTTDSDLCGNWTGQPGALLSGSTGEIAVYAGDRVGPFGPGGAIASQIQRGYVGFLLTRIPAGSVVESAMLELVSPGVSGDTALLGAFNAVPYDFSFHFDFPDPLSLDAAVFHHKAGTLDSMEADVTSLVSAAIGGIAPFVQLGLRFDLETNGDTEQQVINAPSSVLHLRIRAP